MKNAVMLRTKNDLKLGLWATIYLHEGNFHDAYEIVKFCKDIGLDYVVVQEPSYTEFSPSGRKEFYSQGIPKKDIDAMRAKVLSLADDDFCVKVRFPINDDTYFVGMDKECWKSNFCQGVNFYTIISSDGEVYPCWRLWGKKEYSYGSLYDKSFEDIWRGERRKEMEKFVNSTPPTGDECSVCNIVKLNDILFKYRNATSKWKDFLI
jgi:radical SAM protein with 4Fe4S-binding SPASM domain